MVSKYVGDEGRFRMKLRWRVETLTLQRNSLIISNNETLKGWRVVSKYVGSEGLSGGLVPRRDTINISKPSVVKSWKFAVTIVNVGYGLV